MCGSFFDKLFSNQKFSQTAIFVHLFHNITPTNKLAFDVNLGESGPIWIVFDCLSKGFICEYINIFELFYTVSIQKNNNKATESALRHLTSALHENTNIVLGNPFCDLLSYLFVAHRCFWFGLEVWVRLLSTEHSYTLSNEWGCSFKLGVNRWRHVPHPHRSLC